MEMLKKPTGLIPGWKNLWRNLYRQFMDKLYNEYIQVVFSSNSRGTERIPTAIF